MVTAIVIIILAGVLGLLLGARGAEIRTTTDLVSVLPPILATWPCQPLPLPSRPIRRWESRSPMPWKPATGQPIPSA